MIFNSFEFLIFFPVVTALFFILPHKFRWFLLLSASCLFYMSFIPYYILILAFLIVIDYFAGRFIEKSKNKTQKSIFLIISILCTVSTLFIFNKAAGSSMETPQPCISLAA